MFVCLEVEGKRYWLSGFHKGRTEFFYDESYTEYEES